ncbi:unnamed protein product [Prorocentrum cordatum]|uniref:Mediator of RNA polymerase II transcription subunit 31 n=1 Tax=Prorocentrum cordatum TaxID=2364126 RepID=A0ABN9VW31_9DINO|nr:unnamed protein product [Polarella glacialis]
MASAGGVGFPPPPPHWRLFRQGGGTRVAPPRPPTGPLHVFGEELSLEHAPPLLEADEVLYDAEAEDPREELLRLHREQRACSVALLECLVRRPEDHPAELRRLAQLVRNQAALLRLLRAREARALVVQRLREQADEKVRFVEAAEAALPRLEAKVWQLCPPAPGEPAGPPAAGGAAGAAGRPRAEGPPEGGPSPAEGSRVTELHLLLQATVCRLHDAIYVLPRHLSMIFGGAAAPTVEGYAEDLVAASRRRGSLLPSRFEALVRDLPPQLHRGPAGGAEAAELAPLVQQDAAATDTGAAPPARLQDLRKDRSRRFAEELEFVQCLANPDYVHWLATQGCLDEPEFLEFLRYLRYWREPPHVLYVVYPQSLRMLEMLLEPGLRSRLRRQDARALLSSQLLRAWASAPERPLAPPAGARPAPERPALPEAAAAPAPAAAGGAAGGALDQWDVRSDWTRLAGVVADAAWHDTGKTERLEGREFTIQTDAQAIARRCLYNSRRAEGAFVGSTPQEVESELARFVEKYAPTWVDPLGGSDLGDLLAARDLPAPRPAAAAARGALPGPGAAGAQDSGAARGDPSSVQSGTSLCRGYIQK